MEASSSLVSTVSASRLTSFVKVEMPSMVLFGLDMEYSWEFAPYGGMIILCVNYSMVSGEFFAENTCLDCTLKAFLLPVSRGVSMKNLF
jgi:hypothetical protein